MYKGQEYSEAKPVIHIVFLDYTLFRDYPEFYATYKLMNVKNSHIFNDKFSIGVVNLKATELATDEDKAYELDKWVKLFKAKTWEELKMIAENKPEFLEASKTLYEYNADLHVRQQCIAFEDYMRNMRRIELLSERNEKLEKDIVQYMAVSEQLACEKDRLINVTEQLASEKQQLTNANEQLASEKQQLTNANEQLAQELVHMRALLAANKN